MQASSTASAQATSFRRLLWSGSVPLQIKIFPGDIPAAGSASSIDSYYVRLSATLLLHPYLSRPMTRVVVRMNELTTNGISAALCEQIQALRQTYLPLLLGEIRENLVELVLDDQALASIREADWWFEDEGGGGVMKWFVPALRLSLGVDLELMRVDSWVVGGGETRHWPVGLLYDHSLINNGSVSLNTFPPASSLVSPSLHLPYLASLPPLQLTYSTFLTDDGRDRPALTLILHLSTPPSDKLLLSNSLEACKTAFMGAVKEADFVRWGSVKRVTGLRRGEQDALWDGIRQSSFLAFSRSSPSSILFLGSACCSDLGRLELICDDLICVL
jgi:autophagy-related protein 5